jgi:hypothetical protein
MKKIRFCLTVLTMAILLVSCNHTKQQGKEVTSSARYKMTTDIPASITTPDSVRTSLGTLRFLDGFPDKETVKKVYDNLDFQRGVQAFLYALPAAEMYGMRSSIRLFGPDNLTILMSESLLDSRSIVTMPNTETIYNFVWLDSKDGPLVVEFPPNILGFINDFWGRFVSDVGKPGPDKGKGGNYLLLPPGYKGKIPGGYFVMHSRTYGNFVCFRGSIINGDFRPAVENTKNHFRVYPLSKVTDQPAMNFVNISGKDFNSMPATDASLFEHIAQIVQEEPLDAVDPETRGLLASIGIRRDTPFTPDERMKKILADAAAVGNATGRVLAFSTRDKNAFFYPNSAWQMCWIGNDINWSPGGVLDLDARTLAFYLGWGVSPAMTLKMVGIGSQYAITDRDAIGQYLNGAKNYRLHLPPNIPAKDFWSLLVYDPQTRSMLQTDQQFPSCSSLKKDIMINPDTSVDIYFGPKAPPGKAPNWIQTIPAKGWYTMLRLYGPLDPWFDKTWRPGEIELIH